jgi:hypothetical protein
MFYKSLNSKCLPKQLVLALTLLLILVFLGCSQQSRLVTQRGDCKLQIISTEPKSPAILQPGQKVYVNFRYDTGDYDAVQIWARPRTNGSMTKGYKAHGSSVYNKYDDVKDTIQGYFFFDEPTEVDEIIVRMKDNKSSEYVCVAKKKVDFKWFGYSKPKETDAIGRQSCCSSSKCKISPLAEASKSKTIFSRAHHETIEIFGSDELDKEIYDTIAKANSKLINSDENKGKGAIIYRVRSEDGRLDEERARRTRTEFHWTGLGRGGYTPKTVDEGEIKVMFARDGQPAELRVIHPDYHEFRRAMTFEKGKIIVWDDIFLKRVSSESSCTVKGTVHLENDADPKGIRVSGSGASATTDEEGNFVLKGLRSGQVSIGARKSGYHGLYGEVNVNKGQTATCRLKGYRIRKAKVSWMYQPDGLKDFTNNNVVTGTATLQDDELDRVSFAEGFKQVSGKSDFLMYQKEDALILRNFDMGPGRPVINEIDKPFDDVTEVPNLNNNNTYQSFVLEAGKVYVLRCYDGEHYGKMEVLEIIDE